MWGCKGTWVCLERVTARTHIFTWVRKKASLPGCDCFSFWEDSARFVHQSRSIQKKKNKKKNRNPSLLSSLSVNYHMKSSALWVREVFVHFEERDTTWIALFYWLWFRPPRGWKMNSKKESYASVKIVMTQRMRKVTAKKLTVKQKKLTMVKWKILYRRHSQLKFRICIPWT